MAANFDDNSLLTASQAAEALRAGQITSSELVEAVLARIEKYNPVLNAIVTLDADGARRKAQEADAALQRGENWGALHGVPVTIKDSFETAGMRTVSGYPPFANRIPTEDAPPVARLRKAGAIILGKTNLPALASGIQTNNPVFGRTNNPWDLERTPGGSSGGAAAAIAAGLSCLELGSDIGGSIRIPAHFCGIFGLKTTGGRVSGKGHLASPRRLSVPVGWEALLQLGSMGPLARSIDDLRTAFRIISEPGKPGLDPQPAPKISDLRVAWTDDFGGAPVDAASCEIIQNFAQKLVQAGCGVEKQSAPGIDIEKGWFISGSCLGTINTLFQPQFMQWIRRFIVGPFMSRSRAPHALLRGLYTGIALQPKQVSQILKERETVIAQVESFFETRDAWVCPVFPTPAFTHRAPNAPIEVDDRQESQLLANLLHCILFNMTGHPVVTIPVGQTPGGLPVGIQVVGRKWQEMKLLNTAEQIARLGIGYQRPPKFNG